jgi:hypothetical protein
MRRETLPERIEKYSIPEPNSGCILWIGVTNYSGYGVINVARKQYRAHRLIYELMRGPVPDGLVLDHLCRVRCCVNPDHLEPVTQLVNVRRGAKLVKFCKSGHEFTPENTLVRTRGDGTQTLRRTCLACKRRLNAEYARKKRAA